MTVQLRIPYCTTHNYVAHIICIIYFVTTYKVVQLFSVVIINWKYRKGEKKDRIIIHPSRNGLASRDQVNQ